MKRVIFVLFLALFIFFGCDDSSSSSNSGWCGDGIVQSDEVCDNASHGEGIGYDYCSYDCLKIIGWCGDGIKQSNEECDSGSENGSAYTPCGDDCRLVATPWFDPATGLMWSAKSDYGMDWEEAKSYCDNLSEGRWADWRLPTISELRTLIINCSATMTGGNCNIVDGGCLSWDCRDSSCDGCNYDYAGKYSLFGDADFFWSSSPVADIPGLAWYVFFYYGNVNRGGIDYDSLGVRCVRGDSGSIGGDSGDSGADSGDSGSDYGDSGSDSGDSGADSGGDSGSDSGADSGGDSDADSGSTGGDSGDSGADSGDSAADSGDSGADSGDSGADSGDSGSDSGGGAVSAYNCATIHRCVKHCGSDAACRADCVEGGSVDGAKKYKNLTSCIDDNCMFLSEEETAECVNEECAGELKSCDLEEAEIGDFEPSDSGGESGSGVVPCSRFPHLPPPFCILAAPSSLF